MEHRTRKIGGLIAGAGVGAAAASALRKRWSKDPEDGRSAESGDGGQRFLERLSEAVRIPTISHDDPAQFDAAAFDRLHELLRVSYPLVHQHLRREVIAGYSLLYTWEGSDPEAPAVVLMAHQDVVPVESGTEGDWDHDPFSGDIDDRFLWGRGAFDDKASLIGIFEAIEGLLDSGFEPAVTLIVACGHDEETGGNHGAPAIVSVLRDRSVAIDFVLDEGGAVVEHLLAGAKAPIALLGVGEKGYVNLQITARAEGGHSSTPPAFTAIGRLASAISRIERSPMPAHLPLQYRFLQSLASIMPLRSALVLRNPATFSGLLEKRFSAVPITNAVIRTTLAPTVVSGGVKANVLPQSATAVVNVRIMPGDTIESVVQHVSSVVGDGVTVGFAEGEFRGDPPPLSDPDGVGYRLIAETIADVFGVDAAPWILTGATDSRHFSEIAAGAVYRFAPFTVSPSDMGRIHGTNERIRVADAEAAVAFFDTLIRRACGA